MLKGTASHSWQGRAVHLRVHGNHEVRLKPRCLELGPEGSHNRTNGYQCDLDTTQLRHAANIALDLDPGLAADVQRGQVVSVQVPCPQYRPAYSVGGDTGFDGVRPRLEHLIAPLLFNTEPAAPLRPFQERGVAWLANHKAGILADDMGLGKTAQALRAVETLFKWGEIRGALVVCPKSLLTNWEAECAQWTPLLTVVRSMPAKDGSEAAWSSIIGKSHIILTSYEQVRRTSHLFARTKTELVIADEAHRLRKSEAKLVRSFRQLNPVRFWALTGTPIERNQEDLANLLSLLAPNRFSIKSVRYGSEYLKSKARPYILRRLKTDVLHELPDVVDTKEILDLTTEQRRAYVHARSQPMRTHEGEVLQRLTLLRAICDMDQTSGSSVKLERTVEILDKVKLAGEKAVVFSHTLQPLYVLSDILRRQGAKVEVLTGRHSVSKRSQIIQAFKTRENVIALLCSSRVGGEGLTLTEANHVIFINEWWNPSSNAQARDRVVRLGQERTVYVHRFRCRGTVEEVLDEILDRKNAIYGDVVDGLASSEGFDLNSLCQEAAVLKEIGAIAQSPASVKPDQRHGYDLHPNSAE